MRARGQTAQPADDAGDIRDSTSVCAYPARLRRQDLGKQKITLSSVHFKNLRGKKTKVRCRALIISLELNYTPKQIKKAASQTFRKLDTYLIPSSTIPSHTSKNVH